MVRINIEATWHFTSETSPHSMRVILGILREVKSTGTLATAAEHTGMSYRHAWNLVDQWSAFFGEPLVERRRGKGTQLTALGNKLVWAEQHLKARLGPQLHNIAQELEMELASLLPDVPPRVRIHASHGFAISKLSDFLAQEPKTDIDVRYMTNQASLESLRAQECELAAIHLPHGELRKRAAADCKRWLDPSIYCVLGFVTREMGLFVKRGNPLGITGIQSLVDSGISFVNRDIGSGTRLLFEQLLAQGKINSDGITGYQNVEMTHAAVAAHVARGMADTGFGVEAAAVEFDLDFVHVITEDYFFLCRSNILNSRPVERLREIISGTEYRRAVNALPGYAVSDAGVVKTVKKFFRENS
ncbi:helix-turn-helix transcriptional regulator [Mesorhizobium sp. PAMC28654]|uniref:helix-turn-helix transcriptional regulator n=1 Tax=Mesorhizobium sp. PAMC28654 TaxID=2880934 RepID=UPI001D0AA5B9|nr:substrate-binding domain-containing protein [Mesorhizobium sp. PAMC28654]UDL89125.1 helix-turn-helix transcriptional regulator [Mesorhizobium sp. PAMC28654]